MISDSTSPLSKLVFYTKGFVLIVISLTINNIKLNQGVLTTRVPLNGLSNGHHIPDAPVNFLISPSLLSSHQTLSPPQLSTIETSKFFQKANPSYDNLGESIAKTILHSFHLIDDDSEIRPKRNNNVRRKKTKLRDNQSPNEAIAVYRGGEDQGTSFILKESIKSENESPSIDGSSGYILQDDSENENGALTDDEEILSILEQNAKKRKKQKKVDNDEDDDSADEGDDAPVKAKPGRYVIKKIFKGKNGRIP
uniref:Uncharacterized protein n=1 Tax=Tetranychus urticae TaxID=32264 RepID=T1JX54_TETUR